MKFLNIFIFLKVCLLLICLMVLGCTVRTDMSKFITNSTCALKVDNDLAGGNGNFLNTSFIIFTPSLDHVIKDYMCNNIVPDIDYNNLNIILKDAKMELLSGNNFLDDMVSTLSAQYIYKYGDKVIIQDVSVHRVEQENGFTGKREPDYNFGKLIQSLDVKVKDSIKIQTTHR